VASIKEPATQLDCDRIDLGLFERFADQLVRSVWRELCVLRRQLPQSLGVVADLDMEHLG